jgi:hypothetical protein
MFVAVVRVVLDDAAAEVGRRRAGRQHVNPDAARAELDGRIPGRGSTAPLLVACVIFRGNTKRTSPEDRFKIRPSSRISGASFWKMKNSPRTLTAAAAARTAATAIAVPLSSFRHLLRRPAQRADLGRSA